MIFGLLACKKDNGDEPPIPMPIECDSQVTDVDGNSYEVVTIGEQCWMAENLRTTKYADGTSIPKGSPYDTIITAEIKYYDFNKEFAPEASSFGILYDHLELTSKYYTWAAASREAQFGNLGAIVQGVCPDGWRLPNLNDWNQLVNFVGLNAACTNLNSDVLGMWYHLNQNEFIPGLNTFGFNAEANGIRSFTGFNSAPGVNGFYWSATNYADNFAAMTPVLSGELDYVQFVQRDKALGVCVRCIRGE